MIASKKPFSCLTFVHQYLNGTFFFRYSPFFLFNNLLQSCYAFLEYGTISLCNCTLNSSYTIIAIYDSLMSFIRIEERHRNVYCFCNTFQ